MGAGLLAQRCVGADRARPPDRLDRRSIAVFGARKATKGFGAVTALSLRGGSHHMALGRSITSVADSVSPRPSLHQCHWPAWPWNLQRLSRATGTFPYCEAVSVRVMSRDVGNSRTPPFRVRELSLFRASRVVGVCRWGRCSDARRAPQRRCVAASSQTTAERDGGLQRHVCDDHRKGVIDA